MFLTNLSDGWERIHSKRRSGSYCRANKEGDVSCRFVFLYCAFQEIRPHCEICVYFDRPQILAADTSNFNVFFNGRMCMSRRVGRQRLPAAFFVRLQVCYPLTSTEDG